MVARTDETTAYTIDWLENLPFSPFVWPDLIKNVMDIKKANFIGLGDAGITLFSTEKRRSSSRAAVKVAVASVDMYLCVLTHEEPGSAARPGCIIYVGAPDEDFRKKVRAALSFALGVYLIDLGSTSYSKEWKILLFRIKQAYSIDKKVFDIPTLPPVPLGLKSQHDIDRMCLTRMVNSIVDKYDELNFADLSWAYWHAVCATVHIAAVHFGAALESLQRSHIAASPTKFSTKNCQ